MIDEETQARLENLETVIAGLTRRIAVLEGTPEISPDEAKAKARVAYEQRMGGIPSAFWKKELASE